MNYPAHALQSKSPTHCQFIFRMTCIKTDVLHTEVRRNKEKKADKIMNDLPLETKTTSPLLSRKFILATLTLVLTYLLVYFDKISDGVYSAVVIATVGAYITGNVVQKVNTRSITDNTL